MQHRPVEILLVEPDPELATIAQECIAASMTANLTLAANAASALREELTTRHDVLVISTDLPDATWPDLVREIRQTNRGPLLLTATAPTMTDMVEAIRLGARDVLIKPYDFTILCQSVRRASRSAINRQRLRLRHRRLRRLTAKIISERRDLRQRIDLICKDFVHAYRRLAQRVSEADLLPHK